jgi:hypothetical protein
MKFNMYLNFNKKVKIIFICILINGFIIVIILTKIS